tara:strand:- start:24970 stop:25173 length:204 start_codon:yes stop_codon:yes gene_type:complete
MTAIRDDGKECNFIYQNTPHEPQNIFPGLRHSFMVSNDVEVAGNTAMAKDHQPTHISAIHACCKQQD